MPLSDMTLRRATPRAKIYKLNDGDGLALRVTPKGGKYWVWRYSHSGKQKDLSLGVYPAVSLSAARAAREAARGVLSSGIDPGIHRVSSRLSIPHCAADFESVARAWLKDREKVLSPKYAKQVAVRLQEDIFPDLGTLPVSTITPPMLLRTLKKAQARGVHETTRRLKQYCGMIFRFAIVHGMAERDAAADLKEALVVPRGKHYAAIGSEDLPALLKSLADVEVEVGMQARFAIRLLMLTFVRTSELIGAVWSEVDLNKRVWIIPAARMKMKRDHIVPLSRQVVEIFVALRKTTSHELVFPGYRNWKKPISNNTILMALNRMGWRGRMTGHGFRALATTVLREELDHPKDVIDLQLAHAAGKVWAAYDRSKFLKQRTEMMQAWADYVDRADEIGAALPRRG